ncbi:MAG: hypothetical protein ACF8TS_06700 [Maioricimonas sp. JB049]
MRRFYRGWMALLMVGSLLAGCRGGTDFGPMGSVTGKLTMDGEPMAAGTQLLFMQMEAGYAAFGETDAEGNYSIVWAREGERKAEIPTGTYKVLIQPPAVGRDTEELSAEEMLEGGGDVPPAEPQFPRKYQQHSTSGLEYPVGEGENRIDIDISSEE